VSLQLTGSPQDTDLLLLPWAVPLEEWPDGTTVALPRGISRHVVRFVRLSSVVYAVKEIGSYTADREYRMLVDLNRRDVPCVVPVGVISGRRSDSGELLEDALITRHLQFSLPYRALFSSTLRPNTAHRLLDALAVLLVRLHLVGFAWNDCSLSNTLFRRDAGSFAAYLVDAETGELHDRLTDGQRRYDLDVAITNVAGELLDLEAGGLLHPSIDAVATGLDLRKRYEELWDTLNRPIELAVGERYQLDDQVRRLNDLGFDVAELTATTTADGRRVTVKPKVVDAGHHARRLLRLTGIDAEENQARRLLNDLDAFRADLELPFEDEEIVAHQWVTEVFEAVVRAVPNTLRGKLEPAEIFHEVLEHRWFLSENSGSDIGLQSAVDSYITNVLAHKPDERAVLDSRTGLATREHAPTTMDAPD